MWYKFAQNVERAYDTLKTKGVSEEIIGKLEAMTDVPLRGKYIGALMQNPLISWDELQGKFQTNQAQKVSNDESRLLADLDVRLFASNITEEQNANFYKWVTRVALPSYRPNQHDPENYSYPKFSHITIGPIVGVIDEIYHILDWYAEYVNENPRFNIFSMNLDQALRASEIWHEELSNQESGAAYSKIKKENGKIVDPNVVMIFDAETVKSLGLPEEYNDWMMVKLTQERDFLAEGQNMGHCAGRNNYYELQQQGISDTYSLRDESNKPHATVEIGLPDKVKQIQGKGNKTPIPDYKKLVLHWIEQNNFYSKHDLNADLTFNQNMSEEDALYEITNYLQPENDESLTDELGVRYRPIERDYDDLYKDLAVEYLIDQVGVDNNGYYKTYQEIPDDDKFDELISLIGDIYIRKDLEKIKDYASQVGALGTNREIITSGLNIDDIRYKYKEALSDELEKIKDYKEASVSEEYNPGNKPVNLNLENMSDDEINELANQPYERPDARGYNKPKKYEDIYDVYPVHFYSALYTYIRDNMPKEFYEIANKLSINLDVSPLTPSDALYRGTEDYYQNFLNRRNQQKLFTEGVNEWRYSFNNKRFRLASVADEGISNFGYKDLIKPSNDISEEQIVENIKNYYISKVMKQFVSETPDYDSEFYASMTEELHFMWEEYIDDIKKGDTTSLKRVIEIVMDYDLTLADDSVEHKKLSEMLTSGELAISLKRNS
jgi:hypothetical protein